MAYINGGNDFLVKTTLKGDSAFIRYSANADGTDFTETWSEGQCYIGFATGQTAPTGKEGYTWAQFINKPPETDTFEMWVLDSSNVHEGTYTYEKGMTWRDFIDSNYNDGKFYEYDGSLVFQFEGGFQTVMGTNDTISGYEYPQDYVDVNLDDVIEYPFYYRYY